MEPTTTAEIVTIGDELNRGEIVDTNSAFFAEELTRLGLHVRWRTSVTDDAGDMEDAFRRAIARAQVVICSGGLGPTEDDRTVDVWCRAAGVESVEDAFHKARMEARFAERGFRLTPNNLRQIRVPAGATVLANAVGIAPGFALALGPASVFAMPGVPREMKAIFADHVVPAIARLVGAAAGKTARRVWRVAGMGESHVDHALRGLVDGLADVTLHFRIAFPENLVTVVARRGSLAEAEEVLAALDGEVRRRLPDNVYGSGDDTLAGVVGRRLLARGETCSVAESCTGGLLGQLLTSVGGSSAWFEGGVISYANAVKEAQLGVRAATLATHGAVSGETVIEMAEGVRARLGTTWGLAISGVAGPSGGTADKPVGTVWLGVARDSAPTETRKIFWPASREQIRTMAAFATLHMLWKRLRS